MTPCERLSERMPLVALGRERWSPEDEAHLVACAECRREWTLVRTAGTIGNWAPRMAHRPEVASAVLRRLAETPATRPARRWRAWAIGLATAAGIGLAVWTGGPGREPGAVPSGDSATGMAEQLGAAELDSLLQDDEPVAGWSMLESPGMGDLDEDELEQVLSTWEG